MKTTRSIARYVHSFPVPGRRPVPLHPAGPRLFDRTPPYLQPASMRGLGAFQIGAEKRRKDLTFKFNWNGVRPQFIDDDA